MKKYSTKNSNVRSVLKSSLALSAIFLTQMAFADQYLGPYTDIGRVIKITALSVSSSDPNRQKESCSDVVDHYRASVTHGLTKGPKNIEARGTNTDETLADGAENMQASPGYSRVCVPTLSAPQQGYEVTYVYHGHEFIAVTPHDPGATIRIIVTAVPAP